MGVGRWSETPVALTYGLSPEIAAPFLGVGVEQLVRAEP
jgi:hypothetical protein